MTGALHPDAKQPARASGEFAIGGDLPVARLGYGSLRLLGLERVELFQLHRTDPQVPLADQLGALLELQAEGKIGRIGLSEENVSAALVELTPDHVRQLAAA
jgi:diketogulonate reductase-like aldo/keto reductase